MNPKSQQFKVISAINWFALALVAWSSAVLPDGKYFKKSKFG
jgi:hypothetical protein